MLENMHTGLKFLFTPPYSPQYNGRVERRFAVVTQKAMAMMYDAGFNSEFRSKVWGEAVMTASFLCDIFPTQRSSIPTYNLFNKEESKWYPFLIEYGRIGMVTSQKKGKKLEAQGKAMIMVRYALQHKPGSYIVVCDNVSWSKTKQWRESDDMKKLLNENDEKTDQIPDATPIVVESDIPDEINDKPPTAMRPSTRGKSMLKELATSHNDITDGKGDW